MEGWEYKTIDDLAVIDQESLGENTKRDFSFYYIDISSVSEGKLRLPSNKTIFREAPSRARKIVHRGDVLMSMVRPNLKAFTYFNHTDDDCVASTGFAVLTARDQVDARFILYSILSDSVTAQIESLVVGSNYPAINSNAVRRLQVLAPSYPEQTKIAEILSTVDQAIERIEALIAKQQRIKTGLMQDLFTRGIDEHGNLRSEQTHKFKNSPIGRIPVEWEANELRSYLSYLSYGFTNPMPEEKDGPYMVTAANVSNGIVQYDNCRRTSVEAYEKLLTKKSRPKIGDILITKDGTLGRLASVDRLPLCINQSVAVMRPKDGVDNTYLKLLLESPKYQKRILDDAGGSTIKHLYISKIDKIVLGFPKAKEEQEAIKERLLSQSNVLYQYEANLKKLHSLKTALMQDLLTGNRRVTALLKETEISNMIQEKTPQQAKVARNLCRTQ